LRLSPLTSLNKITSDGNWDWLIYVPPVGTILGVRRISVAGNVIESWNRTDYMIFTGPRSSFIAKKAAVFFFAWSQWLSGYSRINCTVMKLPRSTLDS